MNHPCPNCGATSTHPLHIYAKTPPILNKTTYKRYKCEKCGVTFIHDVDNTTTEKYPLSKNNLG